jgi:holliday junction DNA helicase RuvA
MIAFIEGKVSEILENGIIISNNGIGYYVIMPSSDISSLNSGEEIKIHTHLQVSEDNLSLYGFLSKSSLDMFRLLLSVSGIGPRNAVAVLSAVSVDDLVFAIAGEDEKKLCSAPGIGPKTARRIILELKDKVDINESLSSGSAQNVAAIVDHGNKNDAVLALNALGYNNSDILRAMRDIEDDPDRTTEDWIKETLNRLYVL